MPRPKLNREVAEEIASAYEKFDRAELLNYLVNFTRTYIIEGTIPFGFEKGSDAEKEIDFVKLIEQLKRRLPHVPELGYFGVEDGKVILRVSGQKISFGERVTHQFDTSAAAPPSPATPARSPAGAAPSASGGSKPPPGVKPAPKDEKKISDTQQEAVNDIVTRFKNLELD